MARVLLLLTLAFGSAAIVIPNLGKDGNRIESVDLVFQNEDFETGIRDDLVVSRTGLRLEATSLSGQYISPVVRTPIPFNAIVPSWYAQVPYDNTLEIKLRTGKIDGEWGDWFEIHENNDMMTVEEGELEAANLESIGQIIAVPAVDQTHDKLQYAVFFNRYSYAPSSVLKEITFTLIDSSGGPTTDEMLEMVSEIEGESLPGRYPKPGVIPRSVWCTDPACYYTNGLEYESVTHLIIHHTVSSNSNTDWAAIVRAIWHYHTFTRGWGDIGYNYLVDMNGVLYEGHRGGDDVIGTHAAGANRGSLGLAFLGTFTEPHQSPPGITPPAAMLNSAVELLAWKADQKNIDVYSASRLPNLEWGLPHLTGHRDVYGTTVCPGDQAHDLLPWIRDQVASRIGFISPHIYVDDQSSAFTKSSSGGWHTGPNHCGFNGNAFYAWSTTDPGASDNWGEWRPQISDAGVYEIEVYAPFCLTGEPETRGAKYSVTHGNGTDTVTVSQEANLGVWASLGTYYLPAGNTSKVRLTELTSTDSGMGVWFDAIRLRPLNPNLTPEITVINPEFGSWKHDRTVHFQWDVTNAIAVRTTDFRVATDINFNNVLISETFTGARTSFTYSFPQDHKTLYWFVVMSTHDNRFVGSGLQYFGIDTAAPTSEIHRIAKLNGSYYVLLWSGSDATAGIDSYRVEYRGLGETEWQTLLSATPKTYATFYPPAPERTYWFRLQARDKSGLVEAANPSGDVNTSQAPNLDHAIMAPQVFR